MIPQKSAIFVDDFADLGKLIEHINYLDRNDTAYMEYLGWRLVDPRNFYGFNLPSDECELCLKLTKGERGEELRKGKKFANGKSEFEDQMIVTSLSDFFYKDESEECLV